MTEVDAAITSLLGDLDGIEAELLRQQADLVSQLQVVEGGLQRIVAVRQAVTVPAAKVSSKVGRPKKHPQPPKKRSPAENKAVVLEWARSRNGNDFTAVEAGEALGKTGQGVGPILFRMATKDSTLVQVGKRDGRPTYRLA
jgi:hypothetical protein